MSCMRLCVAFVTVMAPGWLALPAAIGADAAFAQECMGENCLPQRDDPGTECKGRDCLPQQDQPGAACTGKDLHAGRTDARRGVQGTRLRAGQRAIADRVHRRELSAEAGSAWSVVRGNGLHVARPNAFG
jgi:hypothetical protein